MNGSHIFAVNVMLGSRSVWPRSDCDLVSEHSAGSELELPQDEQPLHAVRHPRKSAWTRVWQRVSCLLD